MYIERLFWRKCAYGCFWSDFRKWFFRTFFLDSRFHNHADSKILHKYQLLSNQSFIHNLVPSYTLFICPPWTYQIFLKLFRRYSKRIAWKFDGEFHFIVDSTEMSLVFYPVSNTTNGFSLTNILVKLLNSMQKIL